MNKPNVAVLLDTLRLYQKMQAGKGGARASVNTTTAADNGEKKNNGNKGKGSRRCFLGCNDTHPIWGCDVFKKKTAAPQSWKSDN